MTLSGSLLEPKISIDAKKLLLATQKERIDKEKDKLKGKLLDSLFGKDKKKDKPQDGEKATAENPSLVDYKTLSVKKNWIDGNGKNPFTKLGSALSWKRDHGPNKRTQKYRHQNTRPLHRSG